MSDVKLMRRRIRRLEGALRAAREFVGDEADRRGLADKEYPLQAGKLLRRIENTLFAKEPDSIAKAEG